MIDKINKGVEEFQEFFDTNFTRWDQGSVEILLMLAYGHMFDIFTPNQLIQTLGLDKNKVYGATNSWSIHHLRKLFLNAGFAQVVKLVAYLVMEKASSMTRMTFQQIKNYAKRDIDLCSFFHEHFHLFSVTQRL